jgi:uncharacterized protein YuzE
MQMTYDHKADAMYIRLTDHGVVQSKQVNPNFALDLDENGDVIGIEVLNVRVSGIDPLALEIVHSTADQEAERPDPEAMRKGRAARMEALKRQRQKDAEKSKQKDIR